MERRAITPVYFISVAPLYPSEGFTIGSLRRERFKEPVPAEVDSCAHPGAPRVVKAQGPEKWDTGSCGQRGVHQSVAAIVVGDKNRYIPIDPPGAWSVAVRRLSGL